MSGYSESVSDKIYNTSADIGYVSATIKLGAAIVIGLVLSAIAIYLITKKNNNINTSAIIKLAECKTITNIINGKNKTKTTCTLYIEYSDTNSNQYNSTITTSDKMYNIGETIDVSYDKDNPQNVSQKTLANSTLGSILCCIAICIILCSAAHYYFVRNYKSYAAFFGASESINMVSSAFRKN